jgi:hypothetical protein
MSSIWRKSTYSQDTGGNCVEVSAWRKSTHSSEQGGACVEVGAWRKSTHSTDTGGNCVEVGTAGTVLIRDTTDRDGLTLSVSASAWLEFTSAIK